MERVLTKLAGWKTKFLSFVGRIVLVKSIMTAIPNYVMQGVALPAHLYDKLDRIKRDFLWDSTAKKEEGYTLLGGTK